MNTEGHEILTDSSSATSYRRLSAFVEVISGLGSHHLQLEVGVRVDASWHHEFASRIDGAGTPRNYQVTTDLPERRLDTLF